MFTNWKSFFNQSNLLTKLVVINVAVFLIINLTAVFLRLGGFNNYGVISSVLSANSSFLETLYRPWSIFTYQFTHEGLWHLAMNMLVLWFSAQIFGSMLGEKKLLPLYLMGGIGGWLLYAISYNVFPIFPDVPTPIIGASASVMAIVVATATMFPKYIIYLFGILKVELRWIAIGYVLVDIIALQGSSNLGGHLAHLGGAAFGYLYAKQLQKGKDLGIPVQHFFASIGNLFKKKSPLKAKRGGKFNQGSKKTTAKKQSTKTSHRASSNSTTGAQQEIIDRILDKISKSGYDSLTAEEKAILFKESK